MLNKPTDWIALILIVLTLGWLGPVVLDGPDEPEAAQLSADSLQDAIKTAAQAAKEPR